MTAFFLKVFISLFTIMGPFSIVPSFLTLSQNFSDYQKNKVALKAVIIATCILFICALLGEKIFQFFGISLSSFKIAGGILLLLMGINMLHAKTPKTKTTHRELKDAMGTDDISAFPLATPLMAGPGAISTIIILSSQYHNKFSCILIILAVILLCASILFVFLVYSRIIHKFIGSTGLNIMMRMMGLVLSSIAIEQIITGLKASFKFL